MKKFQRIAVLVLSACLVFGMMTVSAFGYGYELTVDSGNGSFVDSEDTLSGTTASIDIDNAKLTVGDTTVDIDAPSNHFVIGMRVTGHDNSEVLTGSVNLADYNEDTSLVVAYGLESNMIKYTINYVAVDGGATVHPSEEHYGVVGQKPVVSYKYVEGYLPDAYNRTGTLTRDGENVFTFYYYQVDANGQIINIQDGNTVVAGNAAGNAAAGAGANAGANAAANIGDGPVPLADAPANSVDIDDSDTPLANADQEEEGGGGSALPYIIGGVAVAAIIAAIAAFLARRRAAEEE